MGNSPKGRTCLYCGQDVRAVRRGDHIVPRIIGGTNTVRNVCTKCNNGVLSELDRELCCRSPMSAIAAQELDTSIWQTWDVDHAAHNLLLEARPDFNHSSMILFPQVVFDSGGNSIRGDYEEMNRFGFDRFQKFFVRLMLDAFRAWRAGEKRRFLFESMKLNDNLLTRYRYPARVFVTHPITKLTERASFVLRYQDARDKWLAIARLKDWNREETWRGFQVGIGSALPTLRFFWDAGKVLRALAKIAVNLLAKYCPKTPVDREHLADIIRPIMGETELNPEVFRQNGFVWPSDLRQIHFAAGHSFRLLHTARTWRIYSSFFSGRICSMVVFNGPNEEGWSCADIRAPLRSANWTMSTSQLLLPLRAHVEWDDFSRMVPSVQMVNVRSERS